MSESYDGDYILNSLEEYVSRRSQGVFDGFEIVFPEGLNRIDPLLLIQFGTVEATLQDQIQLTKYLIANKTVRINLFGTEVGAFTFGDPDGGFYAYDVFAQYPMALSMLIRVCWVNTLKNLLPPLNDSQLAVMKKRSKKE